MDSIQALVISLAGSHERQEKVRSELGKTNLKWRFMDAIRGSTLTQTPREYNAAKVKRLLGFELTPNEIGCFLSHKKAWQECLASNIPTLIFEDDFYLLPHFERSIDLLINRFENWSAIRLQGLHAVRQELIETVEGVDLVRNIGDAVGATAYLIKPDVAKRLIEASEEMYEPLDHFLEHSQKHHISFLAIRPYPVGITGVPSTIADRPGRTPIKGLLKIRRSVSRMIDRYCSKNPWFPN